MLKVFKNFNQVLEAFLAVFVQVLDQPLFFDNLWHVLAKSKLGPWVLGESIVAFDDVLEEPRGRLLDNLGDHHVVEHCTNC